MIKIRNLHKSFGSLEVLKGIDIDINKGECIGIIGGSGSGKSVFLRSIAMLETPNKGSIFIDGDDITEAKYNLDKLRGKVGMVYQGFHLFSHLNVLDNISLAPQKVLGQSKKQSEEKAMKLLEGVGLLSKAKSMPAHLSGGQSQRIAIARCLAMDPKIILFDEPTSALDPTMVGEVLAIIRQLIGKEITMLIVTHEMQFAKDVASRIFYLDEGLIYEEGSPEEIFENPQKEKTRNFIKRLRLLEYEIKDKEFDLIEMVSKISYFCQKYGLSRWNIFTVQILIEEIITVLISQYYRDMKPDVKFTIEYSEEDNKIKIYIFYKGKNINIIDELMDDIQRKILVGKTTSIVHFYGNQTNQIKLIVF